MVIKIPVKFPSLNEYINAERRHRMIAAKMKKEYTKLVELTATKVQFQVPTTYPVAVHFIIHEENKRRDIDNVSATVSKFCLDGLVNAGILPDDSQKYVNKIECDLVVDDWVGVEILIDE